MHAEMPSKETIVLELLARPGHWNCGIAEAAIPLMPRTEMWPGGHRLRIVDCQSGSISLFTDGDELHHDPSNPDSLLPEPDEDEIILMRYADHYSLIRRDQKDVVINVPSDGDCFFSCLSLAFGAKVDSLAESNAVLRQSLVRLLKAEPDLMAFMAPDQPLPP